MICGHGPFEPAPVDLDTESGLSNKTSPHSTSRPLSVNSNEPGYNEILTHNNLTSRPQTGNIRTQRGVSPESLQSEFNRPQTGNIRQQRGVSPESLQSECSRPQTATNRMPQVDYIRPQTGTTRPQAGFNPASLQAEFSRPQTGNIRPQRGFSPESLQSEFSRPQTGTTRPQTGFSQSLQAEFSRPQSNEIGRPQTRTNSPILGGGLLNEPGGSNSPLPQIRVFQDGMSSPMGVISNTRHAPDGRMHTPELVNSPTGNVNNKEGLGYGSYEPGNVSSHDANTSQDIGSPISAASSAHSDHSNPVVRRLKPTLYNVSTCGGLIEKITAGEYTCSSRNWEGSVYKSVYMCALDMICMYAD
jgi:hypothetical protein